RTKADEHIPTYDCELHSRCDGFGDGSGDGSVTDSVTGQNPCFAKDVTDVTDKTLYQVEKTIDDNSVSGRIHEAVQKENILSDVGFSPSHPSPGSERPLLKEPDPSPNPSPDPSPDPSQLQSYANKRLANKLADDVREAVAEGNREKVKEIMDLVKASAPQVRGFFEKSFSEEERTSLGLLKNSNSDSRSTSRRRIFEENDRVVVVNNGRAHGARGTMIKIRSYPDRTGLLVKFDKEIAFMKEQEFTNGDLMYLAPGME
ncbi:hypothetical protein QUB67_26835, partial [Microcoleus sp. ARI1-A1]